MGARVTLTVDADDGPASVHYGAGVYSFACEEEALAFVCRLLDHRPALFVDVVAR